MHELSICQSIASIAERNCGGRPVSAVGIALGAFRQAVPRTLTSCWQIVTDGTNLAGSHLDFEIIPLVITCTECGVRSSLDEIRLVCPECSSTKVEIVEGTEFMVTYLDLTDP